MRPMSPMFGNKDNDAGDGQPPDVDRLLALPVAELAAQIFPFWDSERVTRASLQDGDYLPNVIASWLAGTRPSAVYSAGSPFKSPLDRAVAEAIQALEHAGLLIRTFGTTGSRVHLTRLGERALSNGDAARYLTGQKGW
jgi:hypothetical protein